MKNIEKYISLGMLLFAVGFNLWLYRLEPTSLVDPNDNAFQFALVDRTNQIWDFAQQSCAKEKGKRQTEKGLFNPIRFPFTFCRFQFTFLFDHWVPNWAEGYNLPFYYSHIPQILIVATYRFLQLFTFPFGLAQGGHFSLFTYYHFVIYLLMCLFPLSVFLALRVIKLPWLAAGIGALLASHISTDGLYGLDPPSFLFRGWGLASQLFAMIWLPLGIAYSWKYFTSDKQEAISKKQTMRSYILSLISYRLLLPVFFLTATTMGHLGIGFIAILSLIPLAFTKLVMDVFRPDRHSSIFEVTKNELTKLLLLFGVTIFFLSYWIIPIFLTNDYHNLSFWDPVWKFDSFGWRLAMVRLLNGELFDWGRFPWLTLLVFTGLFACILPEDRFKNYDLGLKKENEDTKFLNLKSYIFNPFALLFVFWLLLYFGRATWGGLIDLIPGMSEFHLSRFIVGIHLAGLFLIPIGIDRIISLIPKRSAQLLSYFFAFLLFYFIIYPQTIRYATHNDFLIKQANENYKKVEPDLNVLFSTLKQLQKDKPGRVYSGRGGNWGKDFKVAETTMFMHLSAYGLPVVLWLPETWSPNSDVEQYFNDEFPSHYALFGIRYVVAPPSVKPQPFWKLLKETSTWKLYTSDVKDVRTSEVNSGYITSGVRAAIVSSSKLNYINVVRLWIQSDSHEKGLYPEITFAKDFPRPTGLPNFRMLDEVTYQVPDNSTHNIFAEPPVYISDTKPDLKILSQSQDADMIFRTKVEVKKNCNECIVILKQSSHPNWRVTSDGKPTDHITVFPFFLAVPVISGTHDIVFSYEPNRLKIFLMLFEASAVTAYLVFLLVRRRRRFIPPLK